MGSHILGPNECIVHSTTFRENPVIDKDINIVHSDENLLIVEKPCSIPVHPCGAYRHNCLTHIIWQQEKDADLLLTTHRLDRLTSGLVLLARTRQAATRITDLFEAGKVRKTYFARVKGKIDESLKGVTKLENGRFRIEGFIHC